MNWALEILELDQDADERAIKRAYARLLRSNRPDDDPDAFQRLHQAYQTALDWHRYRQEFEQDEFERDAIAPEAHTDAEPALEAVALAQEAGQEITLSSGQPPSTHLASTTLPGVPSHGFEQGPALEPAIAFAPVNVPLPQIDVEALVARIIEAAQALPDTELGPWLERCPELWSIRGKSDASALLLERLYPQELAMNGANFDLIAATFGWDEIGSHVDPDMLTAMRGALHVRWVLQAGNESQLALLMRVGNDRTVSVSDARLCRELLVRPWNHWQALRSAWNPDRVHKVRATLQRLGWHGNTPPCPPLDAQQVQFWNEAGEQDRLTRTGLLIGLMRGAMLSGLWLLLPVAVYLMTAFGDLGAGRGWPAPGGLLPLALGGVLLVMLIGMGTLPWKLLWQRLLPWLIPGLAVIGIATGRTEVRFIGAIFSGAALWIATILVLRSSPTLVRVAPMMLAVALFFVAPYITSRLNLSYAELTGGLALLLFGFQHWRYRSR